MSVHGELSFLLLLGSGSAPIRNTPPQRVRNAPCTRGHLGLRGAQGRRRHRRNAPQAEQRVASAGEHQPGAGISGGEPGRWIGGSGEGKRSAGRKTARKTPDVAVVDRWGGSLRRRLMEQGDEELLPHAGEGRSLKSQDSGIIL